MKVFYHSLELKTKKGIYMFKEVIPSGGCEVIKLDMGHQ